MATNVMSFRRYHEQRRIQIEEERARVAALPKEPTLADVVAENMGLHAQLADMAARIANSERIADARLAQQAAEYEARLEETERLHAQIRTLKDQLATARGMISNPGEEQPARTKRKPNPALTNE